jgi:hypothetical protein
LYTIDDEGSTGDLDEDIHFGDSDKGQRGFMDLVSAEEQELVCILGY